MSWQGPRQPKRIASLHRIADRYTLFILQVIVKPADAIEMRVDRFGFKPLAQKEVDIVRDLLVGNLLNRLIQPQHKVLKRVHVVLAGVRRVIPPLQVAPVVDDHIGHRIHLLPSFL